MITYDIIVCIVRTSKQSKTTPSARTMSCSPRRMLRFPIRSLGWRIIISSRISPPDLPRLTQRRLHVESARTLRGMIKILPKENKNLLIGAPRYVAFSSGQKRVQWKWFFMSLAVRVVLMQCPSQSMRARPQTLTACLAEFLSARATFCYHRRKMTTIHLKTTSPVSRCSNKSGDSALQICVS
jgi:hypothetical protein